MMRSVILLIAADSLLAAGWTRTGAEPMAGRARGAAFTQAGVLVWGNGMPVRGSFEPGGCAGDPNGDGRTDLILREGGEMLWLEAPGWRRHHIDGDADFADCLWTTINGKSGVLLIHHQIQARFYWLEGGRWEYRDIYSIYTPSAQGGLMRGDVNGDGLDDIYLGNYWMQAPSGDRGWRLFAINNWWEQARSAMLRIVAIREGEAAMAERESDPARVAVFTRPADPAQFWRETNLTAQPPLRFVQGLAAERESIFVAENAGPGSRVIEFRAGQPIVIDTTSGLFALRIEGDVLTGVGADAIYRWRRVTTGSGQAGRKKPVRGSTASRP